MTPSGVAARFTVAAGPARHRWVGVAVALTLAGLVAAGAVLRLFRIDTQPGGLYQDEAAEGFDAWRLLHEPGFHPLFFADDGGREVPFAYLVAGVFRLAGDSVTALRATAALLGVLALALTPLLLRRFGRIAMLAGTGWAAGSLWLVCVDRDGFRNVTVPLVGTLALWGLLRWQDQPADRRRALAAGALCGLGLWTYQPLKLLPVLALVWLGWLRRSDRPAYEALRVHLRAAALACLVVVVPIAVAALMDPNAYFGRGLAVSAANPDQGGLGSLPLHVLRTLGAFGLTGDPNARHDVDGYPMLPLGVAAIAAAGAVAAWRRRSADPGLRLVLAGLPLFLLPALAATEGGAPHFLRLLGLAPVVAVLVGLGAAQLVELGRHLRGRRGAVLAAGLISLAVGVAGVQAGTRYFGRPAADRYRPYSFDLVSLGEAAVARPGSVVVVSDYDGLTVDFVTRGRAPRRAAPGERLQGLTAGTPVLARSPGELRAALGEAPAATATVVARDPGGAPTVWTAPAP